MRKQEIEEWAEDAALRDPSVGVEAVVPPIWPPGLSVSRDRGCC